MLQQLALLAGFDLAAMAPGEYAHTVRRVREARLRRPRGVVRRPRLRRRAAGRAAERRVRRRAPRAGGRARVARSFVRAHRTGASRSCRRRPAGRRGGCRLRRADGRPGGRHLPPRRRRPPRQPRLRHPERRLAPRLPDRPRPRLLHGHARADVLAHGGPAELARAAASARARRSRRRWCCATASPTWRSARPAATCRTSGSSARCSATCTLGRNLQEAIDAPSFHSNHMPSSFYPRELHLNEVEIEERSGARSTSSGGAGTTSSCGRRGRSGA